MSQTAPYIDVTEASFERDVIERSRETPVVVDFWAAWCGPCRALGPILERLAGEAQGEWLLAKLDVDQSPRLAQAFGVQGIPAVKAFKDGGIVAEFTGALPEPQVRAWLTQLGPSETDRLVQAARAAEERGDLADALDAYRRALAAEPGRDEARRGVARLELAQRASDVDTSELESSWRRDQTDVDAAVQLSDSLSVRGENGRALDVLLETIAMTTGDERDRARLHLLSLLDALDPNDERVPEARRRLTRLLF